MNLDGQYANERFTGECEVTEPAMCWSCGHPYHQITCDCDRTTHRDGIEADGPCGCKDSEGERE